MSYFSQRQPNNLEYIYYYILPVLASPNKRSKLQPPQTENLRNQLTRQSRNTPHPSHRQKIVRPPPPKGLVNNAKPRGWQGPRTRRSGGVERLGAVLSHPLAAPFAGRLTPCRRQLARGGYRPMGWSRNSTDARDTANEGMGSPETHFCCSYARR